MHALGVNIRGAQALIQHPAHGPFNLPGKSGLAQRITQHERQGEYGGERIGLILAGDIRGRAVHGFIQPESAAGQRGRGQHADRAGQHGRQIRQNIAKQIGRDDHIKLFGLAHQLHRGIIDIQMPQFNAGIIRRDAADGLAPELGGLQHIGLVHGTEPPLPFGGDLKGHPRDPFDLMLRVNQSIQTLPLPAGQLADAARLAEIDAAGQLAHDHDVQTADPLRFQGRGRGQLREQHGRAQIGIQPEARANRQQAALRP